MTQRAFTEFVVECAALAWLEALCHAVLHGPDLGASEVGGQLIEPSYREVLSERWLRRALVPPHSGLTAEARTGGDATQWSDFHQLQTNQAQVPGRCAGDGVMAMEDFVRVRRAG